MLALNEALQKTEIEPKARFCCIKYAQRRSILALLKEKADAAIFLSQKSNLSIQTAKMVDDEVIKEKITEHWQRLKGHGMSLARYFELNKIDLF